jgi:hydrogenase maturation protein HypF
VLNLPPELINNYRRRRLTIIGAVQGVGFRPFVYRLAKQQHLTGWVQNNTSGVILEVEGGGENINQFESLLQQQQPALAAIEYIESVDLPLQQTIDFSIIASADSHLLTASIPADIAVCADCLEEMHNPDNRRYRYAFINCSHCGPRYSIITALPYDRSRTSMSDFTMCAACHAEYINPVDRRFHAQPIACPDCGPQLSLGDKNNTPVATGNAALMQAVDDLRQGNIIALKGLGGFHLLADASNQDTVQRLRTRKHRQSKPFALMYPSLKQVKRDCNVSPEAQQLLCSPAAPIVLIEHNSPADIASEVAPGNPYFGVMLAYTPLHHLLLQALKRPLIATSGNRCNEPVCIDEMRQKNSFMVLPMVFFTIIVVSLIAVMIRLVLFVGVAK